MGFDEDNEEEMGKFWLKFTPVAMMLVGGGTEKPSFKLEQTFWLLILIFFAQYSSMV